MALSLIFVNNNKTLVMMIYETDYKNNVKSNVKFIFK